MPCSLSRSCAVATMWRARSRPHQSICMHSIDSRLRPSVSTVSVENPASGFLALTIFITRMGGYNHGSIGRRRAHNTGKANGVRAKMMSKRTGSCQRRFGVVPHRKGIAPDLGTMGPRSRRCRGHTATYPGTQTVLGYEYPASILQMGGNGKKPISWEEG